MLYSGKGICTFELNAADGHVGKIKNLYFDDLAWTIRYLVIETGTWLKGRKVLIAPEALTGRRPEAASGRRDNSDGLTTNLTRSQVRESPAAESDLPVSRQYEERLRLHYAWTSYWSSPVYAWGGLYSFPSGSLPDQSERKESVEERATRRFLESRGDSHLRSLQEVCGYHVHAEDGDIGEIGDLLIESETWRVTHIVAATRSWWPGKHVLIDKGMICGISWSDRRVSVAMTREQIRGSPEYKPGMTIGEPYQRDISSYYAGIAEKSKLERRFDRADPPSSTFDDNLAQLDRSWRTTTGSSPGAE